MFQSLTQSLLSSTNKLHACKLYKVYKPESIMNGDSPTTRFVESDYTPIDSRLKASVFSLSQSVQQGRNLDPVGTLFSQSPDDAAAAIASYPDVNNPNNE